MRSAYHMTARTKTSVLGLIYRRKIERHLRLSDPRHEKAIAKIRAKLFERHTPEELYIVSGSEEIVPSSVSFNGTHYSETSLGGLRFALLIPKVSPMRLSVIHCKADVFNIWFSTRGENTSYVKVAVMARYCELHTRPFHIAQTLIEERKRSEELQKITEERRRRIMDGTLKG